MHSMGKYYINLYASGTLQPNISNLYKINSKLTGNTSYLASMTIEDNDTSNMPSNISSEKMIG